MELLTVKYRIVTPLFLGGADPGDGAELREPSFKAALRYWYRALDLDYRIHESRIFGGTGGRGVGQSTFLLRAAVDGSGTREGGNRWHPAAHGIEDQCNTQNGTRPARSSSDGRTWNLNGLRYFSFALQGMGGNARCYIDVGKVASLTLVFRQSPKNTSDRRRIAAVLWLLGHVGGLGSRARRGFGTLALESWRASGGAGWPELGELPIAHGQGSVAGWMDAFEKGCGVLKGWFPGSRTADHTVLGPSTRFKLFTTGKPDWAQALNDAGLAMQKFRQRHDLSDPNSDYFRVKKHICQNEPRTAGRPGAAVGAAPLSASPERAAFGLPLTFRYSSLAYPKVDRGRPITRNGRPQFETPKTTFNGASSDRNRSASRIHVRIVKIGENYHPLYMRLDGPLLAGGDLIADGPLPSRRWGNHVAPGDAILNDFWSTLTVARETVW